MKMRVSVSGPILAIAAPLLLANCSENFKLPADIVGFVVHPATGSPIDVTEADQRWILSVLEKCEWPRPGHRKREASYRLEARRATGTALDFQVRGTRISVKTASAIGQCKISPVAAQRLAGLQSGG